MVTAVRYVVVSPVRNEAEFLPRTIASMVAQTIRPCQWIIVDDGSVDSTRALAEKAAGDHSWISVVVRADRGSRRAGSGVIEAFYDGYRRIKDDTWDFLVKLDGDLSFKADYFEVCFREFGGNPVLGIAGGTICNRVGEIVEEESKIDPAFHVRGATKIYRAECWKAIGGLIHAPGWDTVDEVKANMLGWRTRTLPGVQAIHHRPTGEAYGAWNDMVKNGTANYVAGYHPLFMFVKCLRRLLEKPYFIGGSALWFGFVRGYVQRIPRPEDRAFIKFFRKEQMNRLLGRKSLWSELGPQ